MPAHELQASSVIGVAGFSGYSNNGVRSGVLAWAR